jgi:hypothetical protein
VNTKELIINPEWEHAQFVSIAELKECEQKLEAANDRIKRLEEAGDAVAAIIGPPGSAHWADENQVDAAWNNWTKAKEAK